MSWWKAVDRWINSAKARDVQVLPSKAEVGRMALFVSMEDDFALVELAGTYADAPSAELAATRLTQGYDPSTLAQ